jgi:hypothetical protein
MVLLMVQLGEASPVQESVVLLEARVAVASMLETWLGVALVQK